MSDSNGLLSRLTGNTVYRLLLSLTLAFGPLTIVNVNPVAASQPAPRNRITVLEIRLLRDLIDGHNFVVQMSQVCVQKASRAQLKSLCQQVITAQQQQIQTMRAWMINWYGVTYAPTPNEFSTKVLAQLEALSGSQFEVTFMKTLVSHHWGAIILGGEIIDRGYHHEFVDLAADVVTSQVDEINQLRSMLRNVYGIRLYRGAAAAGSSVRNVDAPPSLLSAP